MHFQLEPFHKYEAVKENILHKTAAADVCELLDAGEGEGMFRYLEIYHGSLTENEGNEKAEEKLPTFT